jgi:hypothetical protein
MALTLPLSFPDPAWHQVKDRVCPHMINLSAELNNFLGSWQAVRYRYRASWENTKAFTQVIQQPDPKSEDQYYQEDQMLSELFSNGLSALESFCFCLYFAGAFTSQRSHFPLITKPREIALKKAATAFQLAFPSAALSTELANLQSDSRFVEWSDIRNVLAHRVSPGRIVYISNWQKPDSPSWTLPAPLSHIPLDTQAAQARLDWLTDILNRLVGTADQFTKTYF